MVRMSLTRRASLFVLAGSSLFGLPGSGFAQTPSSAPERDFGVLVMAHGGSDSWDRAVETMLAPLRADHQMEIAFGMADAASLQESVRKLEAQAFDGSRWFGSSSAAKAFSSAPSRSWD
jgi:hypothetical protein